MSGEPVPLLTPNEDSSERNYEDFTGLIVDDEPLIEDDAFSMTEITALVRRGET